MIKVIGIGNDFRHDDAAGLIAARLLKTKNRSGIEVAESSGEGTGLMDLWNGADSAILIDATSSRGAPGSIQRFEAHLKPLPTEAFRYSTHAFSLGEAVELARAMNQLPPSVIVFGIEGENFSAGEGLSPEVERGVKEVVEKIMKELKKG